MKKKIAIVDDEQPILDMLKRFLSRRADLFDIDLFVSPNSAYDAIVNRDYDLVLSDIMMPGMDGITLLKKLRERKPNLKVIMMTAFSTEEKIIECDVIGADDYVTKPFVSMRDVENKVLDKLGL